VLQQLRSGRSGFALLGDLFARLLTAAKRKGAGDRLFPCHVV
jgi:hypothetical protein